jgi:TolA-binding protein
MTREHSMSSATDEPIFEPDSLELFWEQHKSKVIGGAIALVLAIAGVFGWLIVTSSQRHAAEAAFGAAKTADEYRAVIASYPSQPVAGDAALLLAKSLRGEKKYDDANAVLDQFIKSQPEHPFMPLAKLAAAQNLALAGKTDDAEKAFEQIAQTDAKSFAAPVALAFSAQLKTVSGDREGALATYRELTAQFPTSIAAKATQQLMQALTKLSDQPVPADPSVPSVDAAAPAAPGTAPAPQN